jgi:hypothetical protein
MKRALWQSIPRPSWKFEPAKGRVPHLGGSVLGVLLLALVAAGCNDQGSKPTSPLTSGAAAARRSGTPADPGAAIPSPHFALIPEATSNAGPAVGVLAYCADLTGAEGADNVARALLADGRFGSVTVIDGDESRPSAADLLGHFAAVVAMTDNRCGQPIPQDVADAAANALAGFAQGGGGVVLTTFGFSDQSNGGIGFGAVIFADGLSPMQPAAPGNAAAGAVDVAGASTAPVCLALLDGVTSPLSSTYANQVSLSNGATWCASYANGLSFLAVNSTGNVVGLNSFPAHQLDVEQPAYARLVSNTVFAVSHVSSTVEVVPAGDAATITLTTNGTPVAGLDIPEGTFTENVTLTARFVSTAPNAPCHAYLLGQIGRCLQLTAVNDAGVRAINQLPMTAGLCLPTDVGPRELFKFEEPHDTPRALKQIMVPFLDCDGFQVGSAAPSGSLKGLAMGLAKKVGQWLSPTPLYAAHGGFGGQVLLGDGLSYFRWASPLQVSNAGLAVNVFHTGKDAYALTGTFDLATSFNGETGFTPATDAVTVAFGNNTAVIPAGSFRYSAALKRWLYAASTTSGNTIVTAMSIEPTSGKFSVAATVPTGGALPINKPFTVQVGHRAKGLLLVCASTGICAPQEP